jgi:hypothetical protein
MLGVKHEAEERLAKEENKLHTLGFVIPYWKFL